MARKVPEGWEQIAKYIDEEAQELTKEYEKICHEACMQILFSNTEPPVLEAKTRTLFQVCILHFVVRVTRCDVLSMVMDHHGYEQKMARKLKSVSSKQQALRNGLEKWILKELKEIKEKSYQIAQIVGEISHEGIDSEIEEFRLEETIKHFSKLLVNYVDRLELVIKRIEELEEIYKKIKS